MYSLKECQQIIEFQIANMELPENPSLLYNPIRYILNPAGKRIRPSLVLLACNLFSDTIDTAVNPALAIEIFHNFTLLHDDIMDKSEVRRGKATVHRKWNENVAILSGDTMMIKAYEYLSKSSPDILLQIFEIFNETAIGVCEGQQYDMDFELRKEVSVDNYLEMIELKTAVLMAASLEIGSICGGANDTDAGLMHAFGKNLGIAFQLQDDLLDVYADQKVFGKAIGGDIAAGKKTFLLLNAFDLAKGETLVELMKWYSLDVDVREEKIKNITAIFNQLKIKELTELKMNEYYRKALSSLEMVSVNKEKKGILQKFAADLMGRVK